MRNHLQLFINGHAVRVDASDAFLTLSDFLRLRQRLVGTKVVCAEGDCGACSVLVGRPRDGRIEYAAVTSCIVLMYQLDATHVVTVEGLKEGTELNALQRSMVECHGAQCGFCTPGFVVTAHAMLSNGACDDQSVRRGLVGNLCRCTGYDSIVRAVLQTDRSSLKPIDAMYPPARLMEQLKTSASETVSIETPKRRCFKPATLAEAAAYRAEHPDAAIVSGATDMGVLYNKRTLDPADILCLSGLPGFGAINVNDDAIHVGGGTSLSALEMTARTHFPRLAEYLQWFGSPLIKNAGTLAGNLATASPIGDMTPPLVALGAKVELVSTQGARRVAMDDFVVGYRKTAMRADELIAAIHIPIPSADTVVRFYKVSKRKDLDISSFSASFVANVSGGTIHDIRIAMGGVGPTVLRMKRTEAALNGQPATLDRFEQAAAIAGEEVTPITDVRGSERYRRTLAGNILLKLWHDAFDSDPGPDASHNGHPSPARGAEPMLARDPQGGAA